MTKKKIPMFRNCGNCKWLNKELAAWRCDDCRGRDIFGTTYKNWEPKEEAK